MRCTFEGMLFVLLLCSHSPAGPAYSPEVASFICYQAPLQLLQNVVVNNGAGAAARENQDILLRNGLIAAIAPYGELSKTDAEPFDLRGRTVMPDFVMLHEHLM